MGERIQKLEKIADEYEDLKVRYDKLEGELAMRKRAQHGKGSEKPKETTASSDEKTKDDDENDYIENGSRNDIPPVEDPDEEENISPSEPPAKKERDNSNRPEHCEKGHH